MTRLVIFDLDGTLLDTIDDLAASTNYALRRNGYPEHELAAYRYFVGNGVAKLIERALPEAERNAQNVERLRRDFVEYYTKHSTDLTKPYPVSWKRFRNWRGGNRPGRSVEQVSGRYGKTRRSFLRRGNVPRRVGPAEGIAPKPDPTIVRDILSRTGFAPPKRSMSAIRASICRRRATAACARSA
ncbi:MAG: HAD family hydrolase [Alistipes sp.]